MATRERTATTNGERNALRMLSQRASFTELLDRQNIDPRELERNLRDLARLNRLPGGRNASVEAITRLLRGREAIAVVDVGAGLGDIPLEFARHGWRTLAADSHPQVLRAARAATRGQPLIQVVEADARSLPFADGEFDVAHCSLLVHHLDREDALLTMREMARVSRLGVVVNDLRRGIVPFVVTALTVAVLGRCRATRVDGLHSVRRAYTLEELDGLLADAGLAVTWRSNRFMPRVVTAAVRRADR
jgi:SAM-dependent methyltransferase